MIKQQIIFPVTTKQFLIVIAISFIAMVSIYNIFASSELTPKEVCEKEYANQVSDTNETNRNITQMCVTDSEGSGTLLKDCLNKLLPSPINTCGDKEDKKEETLRSKFGLADCRFTNEIHKLPKYNLEWKAYDIACDKGKSFDVRSPGDYAIVDIGYGANLGNYIILRSNNVANDRIVLGHIVTSRQVGDYLHMGDVIGQSNISGASTGMHIHIELWDGYRYTDRNIILGKPYENWDGTRLLNHRGWDFGQPEETPPTYYFTAYNLGDVKQNDSTPCIGASGKDLCYLERSGVRTMALTKDIRDKLGISFGEKVLLKGDKGCEGVYQVEDEMNKRFRQTPGILRPGTNYYIKGDLPSKEGGACSITKL